LILEINCSRNIEDAQIGMHISYSGPPSS
jgi:hypothetical protein